MRRRNGCNEIVGMTKQDLSWLWSSCNLGFKGGIRGSIWGGREDGDGGGDGMVGEDSRIFTSGYGHIIISV